MARLNQSQPVLGGMAIAEENLMKKLVFIFAFFASVTTFAQGYTLEEIKAMPLEPHWGFVDMTYSSSSFTEQWKREVLESWLAMAKQEIENPATSLSVLELIPRLRTRDAEIKAHNPIVVLAPSIEVYLKSPSPELRKSAAAALGEIGARESALQLTGLLMDGNLDVRLSAIKALGLLKEPTTLLPLMAYLSSAKTTDEKTGLIQAIGGAGAKNQNAALTIIKYLNGQNVAIQEVAFEAMGNIGLPEYGKLVAQTRPLQAPGHPATAAYRIDALTGMGYCLPATELTQLLKFGGMYTRFSALTMVVKFKVSELRDVVTKMATSDRDPVVRDAAQEALTKI